MKAANNNPAPPDRKEHIRSIIDKQLGYALCGNTYLESQARGTAFRQALERLLDLREQERSDLK